MEEFVTFGGTAEVWGQLPLPQCTTAFAHTLFFIWIYIFKHFEVWLPFPFRSKCGRVAGCVPCVYSKVELEPSCFDIDKSDPQWYHYFICGYRGILEYFGVSPTHGLDILCDGTIAPSSGLSSSSAFVCCAALVTMHVYDKQLSRVTNDFCFFTVKIRI